MVDNIAVIDSDTHVQEPPDLWTSRAPRSLVDRVPQVRWDEDLQSEFWYCDDQRLISPGATAFAGWKEYPPDGPRRFSEIDPSLWEAKARLRAMDAAGIYAQLLYPNIATFATRRFAETADRDIHTLCITVYNDYVAEWSLEDPKRLIPLCYVPFWDIRTALTELERCRNLDHRGLIMTQDPTAFGMPSLSNRHWDPLWAAAQELEMSVNFHIGSGDMSLYENLDASMGLHSAYASIATANWLANAYTISQLIFGGVCHRFPRVDFVSVESGAGWLPFAAEAMDWQWLGSGVHKEHPEYDLLPSEYMKRQIYGSFWFERECGRFAIGQFEDNIFYETDYPHPTSMSPGPASPAVSPREFIEMELADNLSDSTLRKILHDNAARVYRLS